MATSRDTFESVIYVNGEQANDAIAKMTKRMADLNTEYEKLKTENGELHKDTLKKKKDIDSLQKSIDGVKKGVDDYAEAIKNLNGRSIDNLVKLKRQLNSEIKKLVPGTEEYIKLTNDYKKVDARISSLQKAMKGVNREQNRLESWGNKVQGAFITLNGIWGKAVTALRGIAKLTKEVIHSSQTMGDAWDNAVTAMKTATNAFFVALSTGNWDAFNGGLSKAIKNAKEYAATLDRLESRRISNDYLQAEYLTNYREDMVTANDKSQDEATRRAALESAKQNLAEYINSIEKLGSDTRDNLMASYKAMFGIDYTGDELGFEKFFDELYKNVIVGENETVNKMSARFYELKSKAHAELTEGWSALDYQGGASQWVNKEAKKKAMEEMRKEFSELQMNLWKGYEIVDDQLKADLADFKQYKDAIREVSRYQKQLNTESATFEKQIESEKAAAAKKALEDKKAAAAAAYEAQMKQIEKERYATQQHYAEMYMKGEIDKKAYDAQMIVLEDAYLAEKLALNQRFGKDTDAISQTILDRQIKRYEEAKNKDAADKKTKYDEELSLLKQSQKNEETELKKQLAKNEITQDEYDTKMLELKVNYLKESLDLAGRYGQDETQTMQAYLDAQVEAEMLAIQQMEKLKKEAKDVKDSLRTPEEVRGDDMAKELERLEELHDAKLLSEEEYEKAVQAVHDKYKQQQLDDDLEYLKGYFEKANKVIEGVSEFTSVLQSAETAKLEAEYQAQLTAAGDNAEQREAIEAEYEQKKLDLQKKYADVDMAINIAKATASGALAAVEAFAAAKGNPVLGAVYAGIIAATTAAEIATIVAQRNAIKNTSVNGSSSGNFGTRKLNAFADGGYTPSNTTIATVGERGREFIAPAWMVRRNPVMFADLDRYRRTGISNSQTLNSSGIDNKTAIALTEAINKLTSEGVQSFMVYDQFNDFIQTRNKFKKITSR